MDQQQAFNFFFFFFGSKLSSGNITTYFLSGKSNLPKEIIDDNTEMKYIFFYDSFLVFFVFAKFVITSIFFYERVCIIVYVSNDGSNIVGAKTKQLVSAL